jgi:hypothetical protein
VHLLDGVVEQDPGQTRGANGGEGGGEDDGGGACMSSLNVQ